MGKPNVLKLVYDGNTVYFDCDEIRTIRKQTANGYDIKKTQDRAPKLYRTNNGFVMISIEFYINYTGTIEKLKALNENETNVTIYYEYYENPTSFIVTKITDFAPIQLAMGGYLGGYIAKSKFRNVSSPGTALGVVFSEVDTV